MSITQPSYTLGSVEMLPGVRHYETAGFAATWEAYDALTTDGGWVETRGDTPERAWSMWKRNTIDDRNVVVHAPTFDRPVTELRDDWSARR